MLIDRKDDVINICEEKFSIEEYSIDKEYEQKLINKREAFRRETRTKKALHMTMITFSGLKKNMYSGSVIHEITGDDLFDD